ncbi:protein-L-isoaspartate(D-aspartate) O-methyltransferase [bacterium]|nr:protein-L-isoaspartate(D-aspartate) O-methyltransferase [bacterium]
MQQFRESMVSSQLVARGIKDAAVLAAFRTVPRHRFIPEDGQKYAYADHPVSIGHNQTISQPYMVALMTELLDLKPGEKVLEIGTGSGYQAAILAELVGQERVFTIEIIKPLGQEARQTLQKNGYGDIHCLIGDGYLGWPDNAPFDGIVVTAAPTESPKPLVDQLAEGGHLVVPVDNEHGYQTLKVITKKDGKIMVNDSIDCRFVPFLGEHGKSMPPE